MGYSGIVFSDLNEQHLFELKIEKWFFEQNTMSRSSEFKYWWSMIHFPFTEENERFFVLLRYLEEIEKDDSLFNISSAYQLTEIYLKSKKVPSMIKQAIRLANHKLHDHLVSEYPIMGRFASFAMVEREPLFKNVS